LRNGGHLADQVSPIALALVNERIQKAQAEKRLEYPSKCTGHSRATYGIPCSHEIRRQLLQRGISWRLRVEDFSEHWRLAPGQVSSRPAQELQAPPAPPNPVSDVLDPPTRVESSGRRRNRSEHERTNAADEQEQREVDRRVRRMRQQAPAVRGSSRARGRGAVQVTSRGRGQRS
jgi:hypothetical protein